MIAIPVAVLLAIIAGIVICISVVLCATVYRRESMARKYRKLDESRNVLGNRIREILDGAAGSVPLSSLAYRPGSIRWVALRDVLTALAEDPKYGREAIRLFDELGYREQYERRIHGRNVISRSYAVDILGRMRSERSAGKLIPLLDEEDGEIVTVAVRALGRIGALGSLDAILERLPGFYSHGRVAKKAVEISLRNFGPGAIRKLIEYGARYADPASLASALEVLTNLKAVEALPFAFGNLGHGDPEVRAKALKCIASAGEGLPESDKERVVASCGDPVWFVRLQAVKAVGALRYGKAWDRLGAMLLDGKWQVRNAAAAALSMAPGPAVDIFLRTLQSVDRYAKESICEEIQKTDFMSRLMEGVDSPDPQFQIKSREILRIMCSLNYCTPIREYLKAGPSDSVRKELAHLAGEELVS